uniref:Serpin domain-containing protein n=1 Tax=Romanomermis culicivorax TaxID=13658 RepID=A0A915LBE5_ROMCU
MTSIFDCIAKLRQQIIDLRALEKMSRKIARKNEINENLSISMLLLLFTRNPVFLVAQQKVLRSIILCLILFSPVDKLLAMETVQKEKFVEKSTDFGLKIFDRIVDQKTSNEFFHYELEYRHRYLLSTGPVPLPVPVTSLVGQTDGAPCSTFISPTSINVALAMLYAGADKSTKQEMNKMIFGQMDDNVIESNVQYLSKMLNKTNDAQSGYTLTLANGVFAESKINQWVAQKTNQKIVKLFEDLDKSTRLVLANAIYFKGDWHTKFVASKTADAPFHVTEQKSTQLPFMHARNKFFHFNDQDQDWSVLGLPYKGQQLMMAIFLPKEGHRFQLTALQKQLTGAKFWKLIDGLQLHDKMDLDVQMPKFKFETEASLVGCLQAMGVTSMFTPGQANLLKISPDNDLFVSAIAHKAVIEDQGNKVKTQFLFKIREPELTLFEKSTIQRLSQLISSPLHIKAALAKTVNEEGSEAAAATGVAISTRSMPMYDRFVADHPFLFAIVDKTSRCLLFLGQFTGKKW